MTASPALVTLHVWGVDTVRVPGALRRMAGHRRRLRGYPGATFAKLMGTGSGDTFTIRDSDARHWALVTCWDTPQAAATFERSTIARSWAHIATETLRLELVPLRSIGQWSGREPFGNHAETAHAGPVAALTRARLRAAQATAFWRAVPPVSRALHDAPGLLLSLGVGEAPIGLQGTFSVWSSGAALDDFAYASPQHRAVIERTRELGWYAEELFARFAVTSHSGTYRGRPVADSTT